MIPPDMIGGTLLSGRNAVIICARVKKHYQYFTKARNWRSLTPKLR